MRRDGALQLTDRGTDLFGGKAAVLEQHVAGDAGKNVRLEVFPGDRDRYVDRLVQFRGGNDDRF